MAARHWAKFAGDMFPPMPVGGDELVLRPATCPHHALVYASKQRSYRDLPVRLAELAPMFRSELSGVLGGLSRVRQINLDDAHVFCTEEQIRRRGGVLRPEGRRPGRRPSRAGGVAVDRPAGLQSAGALRPRLRRRGRVGAEAGDDPPRHHVRDGAAGRTPDRAVRRVGVVAERRRDLGFGGPGRPRC
ncbi:MAG TPA: aminoacyl--tRNA ligase-related protein [Kribbellaceae bacterium]